MSDEPQDTGSEQPTAKRRMPPIGKRFVKGDPRINRSGRPRSFDEFRALAREIAQKMITDKVGNQLTVADAILQTWARSKEPQLQRAFIEYAFGKVPDKLETPDLPNKTTLILHYGHEREKRDRDHQRLSSGLSPSAD